LSLKTPLVVIRWIVVLLAVLAWLIIVPIVELIAIGIRALGRAPGLRRLRRREAVVPDNPMVAVSAQRAEGPANRE
jgi:hypothetical protein